MNAAQLTGFRTMARQVYPFTLEFTREFTSGHLVGLTHDDEIGFCRASDGDEWISSVNQQNAAGKLNYRVTKWTTVDNRKGA